MNLCERLNIQTSDGLCNLDKVHQCHVNNCIDFVTKLLLQKVVVNYIAAHSWRNMEVFKIVHFFLFLTALANVCSSQGCGRYCVCSLEKTDCYFSWDSDGSCLGKVPLLETYVLNVHGPVCDNVRKELTKSLFSNTIKVFHNDNCEGVSNCRQVCV